MKLQISAINTGGKSSTYLRIEGMMLATTSICGTLAETLIPTLCILFHIDIRVFNTSVTFAEIHRVGKFLIHSEEFCCIAVPFYKITVI